MRMRKVAHHHDGFRINVCRSWSEVESDVDYSYAVLSFTCAAWL